MHLLVITSPSKSVSVEGFSPHNATAAPRLNSPSSSGSPEAKSYLANHFFVNEYAELQTLTKRWRWALRLAERGAGGRRGLMGGSLRRIEALFTEWQTGKSDGSRWADTTVAC